MKTLEWIAAKRDGRRLDDAIIAAIVDGYTSGSIPDYQMAALMMAIYFQGMDSQEVVCLTREMLNSGQQFCWPDVDGPVVDKHSTGGIGDKVSIVLAPLLAAAGMYVPMISGRGLGTTGGTLDKMESIPGLSVDWSMDQIERQVRCLGCAIAGASQQIAPADRRIYALRDVTATVPSIPLITASVLSKKLAEGLQALVLDVKCGSGAFMNSHKDAVHLARSLVSVASELGVPSRALITDMNQPLGRMVGNANEINESVDVLSGSGPKDVRELTLNLAVSLFELLDHQTDPVANRKTLEDLIDGGHAMQRFEEMVVAQGGQWNGPLQLAPARPLLASTSGWLSAVDASQIGWSIIEMGGGRKQLGDTLNHFTGLEMLVKIGDCVDRGQPLMNVFCNDNQFETVHASLFDALVFSDSPCASPELVLETVSRE